MPTFPGSGWDLPKQVCFQNLCIFNCKNAVNMFEMRSECSKTYGEFSHSSQSRFKNYAEEVHEHAFGVGWEYV